jgi:ABC-type sugar transport system ATPase subunit
MEATTIYVTHDQEVGVTLADRVIVMDQGEILQIGTAEELTDTPVNEFVAEFIGEPAMNFIEGLGESDDRLVFSYGESPVYWQAAKRVLGQYVNKGALVGFRPEKVKVFEEANPKGIRARVDVVEFLGEARS